MGIQFDNATYRYEQSGTAMQLGLDGLQLKLREGSFTAVLGAPGSGKSTLLQHLNGLLLPSEGSVRILDCTLEAAAGQEKRGKNMRRRSERSEMLAHLRRRVGLVFQFPEQQLFEETVEKDIGFGPQNFGATASEAVRHVRRAAAMAGLEEELLTESPFRISDGQMRKAAIAGVLAADPKIIALDEPTASLDPFSRLELMRMLQRLCRDQGKTIVIATHQLEEVMPYADEFVVMHGGKVIFQGGAGELLRQGRKLEEEAQLILPPSLQLLIGISERFGAALPEQFPDAEQAAVWIRKVVGDSFGNRE